MSCSNTPGYEQHFPNMNFYGTPSTEQANREEAKTHFQTCLHSNEHRPSPSADGCVDNDGCALESLPPPFTHRVLLPWRAAGLKWILLIKFVDSSALWEWILLTKKKNLNTREDSKQALSALQIVLSVLHRYHGRPYVRWPYHHLQSFVWVKRRWASDQKCPEEAANQIPLFLFWV